MPNHIKKVEGEIVITKKKMIQLNLLLNFLKEEIRLHSNMYNSKSFYSYPLMLTFFFALITTSALLLYESYDITQIGTNVILIFFVGGIMSGAFGLYARDLLERKFGDFARLFSNTQILPIPLKTTFLMFAISDSLFYLFWFILPTILGLTIGILIIEQSIVFFLPIFLPLLVSSFLMFILGLFTMFFFSVLYERSKLLFSIIGIITLVNMIYFGISFQVESFFILDFYITQSFMSLLYSILLILFMMILSFITVGTSFSTRIKNQLSVKSYSFSRIKNIHIMKDYIDLRRTGGLLGKPLFTVIIPSVFLLFVFTTIDFLATLNINVLFFSIIFGTLGTQLFNSLISSDDFRYYRFLPISLEQYITSKIQLSFIINFSIGLLILLGYYFYSLNIEILFQGVIVLAVLLIYNFTLSFYLTGLHPNENLVQTHIFAIYFILFFPTLLSSILLVLLFNSLIYYIGYIIIFLLLSKLYLYLGLRKWDNNLREE